MNTMSRKTLLNLLLAGISCSVFAVAKHHPNRDHNRIPEGKCQG